MHMRLARLLREVGKSSLTWGSSNSGGLTYPCTAAQRSRMSLVFRQFQFSQLSDERGLLLVVRHRSQVVADGKDPSAEYQWVNSPVDHYVVGAQNVLLTNRYGPVCLTCALPRQLSFVKDACMLISRYPSPRPKCRHG